MNDPRPTILAIDSSTERLGVALLRDEQVVCRHLQLGTGHAQVVLAVIQDVLGEAGVAKSAIDALAVCRGPGGFTGLRIALGVVQGLALALERPVVPVSGLRVLAASAQASAPVLAVIDARMNEFYVAAWTDSRAAAADHDPLLGECLASPAGLQERLARAGWPDQGGVVIGPGVASSLAAGLFPAGHAAWPDAEVLARLGRRDLLAGRGVTAEAAQPVYLRDQVAVPSVRRPG
ncbi:MAG: tRNA (adenosine(37)-N6)-threonylcarbamoyltransferase complex dimerization subunit type 1 TsaB [Gammaproteobacteria bacterium]